MKKVISLIVLAVTLFAFVGCSEQAPNVPVKDIMTNIENESEIASGLMELDLKKAELNELEMLMVENMGLNLEDIEEGIIRYPMMNLQVDSVILLKAKDSSKLSELKTSLEKYIEDQKKAFENYVPQNLEVINNHVLKEEGNYIILIISHEVEKIEEAFDNSFSSK